MNKGLVSIITPVYNGSKFLERSIESVLMQSYSNWELILVDDGSNDDSVSIIQKYLKDRRIVLLRNKKNQGIPVTRNNGIKKARGEYVALLDQDDEWFPNKLQHQVAHFDDLNNTFGLVYTNLEVRFGDGRVIKQKKEIEPCVSIEDNLKRMLTQNLISSPTVLIRKTVFDKVGLFNENILWGGDDYDLWLRIAYKYRFSYINNSLSIRYEHQKNYSSNKKRMMIKTIELGELYARKYGFDSALISELKSNHYYRYGVESLKEKKIILGVYYILKSLFISKKGLAELLKTIRNRFSSS